MTLAKKIAKDLLEIEAVFLNPENPFTWASGLKSPIYCDNRMTMSYPAVRRAIANGLAEKIKAEIEKNSPLPEPIKTPEQLKAEQEKAEKRAILLQIQALKEQNSTKKEVPTPAAKPKPLFSEEDKKRLDAAINRKKELEQKQQELINKLSSAQNQTFETPQQARCFYNANKPASNLMWECNYVHYVHPGPHDCARPDLGGKWIIDYGK